MLLVVLRTSADLSRTSHMTILLADDDAQMRDLLQACLQRAGYQVLSAESGQMLLHMLEDAERDQGKTPDLVITDVRMSGMTGLRVLSTIRVRHPSMPVILITAFGDAETHARARALGADSILDKPFALDRLIQAVRGLLKQPAT